MPLENFLPMAGGGDVSGTGVAAFRATLDAIPLIVVGKSLREEDFGEFVIWNREAAVHLGISAEEALGHREGDFFPADQAEFFRSNDREAVRRGGAFVVEAEPVVSRGRGLRLLRTTRVCLRGSSGTPEVLLSIAEDATEGSPAGTDLGHALDLVNSINSHLPGAVYQFRVEESGRFSFLYVSEGIRLVSGDEAQDVMSGRVNLLARILPDDLPAFLARVARSRSEMSHWRQEFRLRANTGDVRWVLASALPKRQPDGSTIWHGFLSDITSAKQATEAARRGEQRLHSALEATRAAAWELDLESGEIYLSPEWTELFGFSELPVSVAALEEYAHPDDRALLRDVLRTDPGEGERKQVEIRHLCQDGGFLWVLVSGKPVGDGDGRMTRRVGTLMDISDRRRTKEQLIEAKEAAERASRAKGEFLAMMSHEIRTPLNAVLGFSELLAAMPLGDEQADHLRIIRENSSALMVVLNDVLDYSKIESGKLDLHLAPMSIPRMVRSVAGFFRPQARAKGLKLNALLGGNLPQILMCDAPRLNQILHNLLSNAVKFTERGGITVQLAASGPKQGAAWPITLRIADTGIGIALDRHPSLFDPFYQADSTTRRRFGGTGLGLTIVRKLVGLMGGTIDVESEPGKGTTFAVHLLLEEPANDLLIPPEHAKRATLNLGHLLPKILVVEDNATNRRLVRLFLKKLGHETDEAGNGYLGVEMAKTTRYDIIFMDLEMPGMDGYEATRLIRHAQEDGGPYIVALTAHAMPEYRERSLQAGMNAYLSKPIRQEDLKKTLREALGR